MRIASHYLGEYRDGRITLQRLASLYGVSVATVWREMKRRGVSRGSRRGRPVSSRKRSVVLALADQGLSRQQIAERLGVTPEWVRAILADNDLAVSLRILKCSRCGAPIATGHKVHQPKHGRDVLCVACLGRLPDVPLGTRLKTLRLADNLSVAQLSEKSGLSRAAIGNYERGRGQPSGASARKLARALGVSLPTLMGESSG